jgi:hypothetical protein
MQSPSKTKKRADMTLHLERSAKHIAWMRSVRDAEDTRILWLNIMRSYFPLGVDWLVFPEGDHTVRDLPNLLTLFHIDNNIPKGELPKKHGLIVVQHADAHGQEGRPPANTFWEAATQHLIGVINLMLPRPPEAPTIGVVASGPWFIVIEQKTTGLFDKSFVHVPIETAKGGHAAHVVDDGDELARFIRETIQRCKDSVAGQDS